MIAVELIQYQSKVHCITVLKDDLQSTH